MNMQKRIQGRTSTKLDRNEFYPKFIQEQPEGYRLIESESGLASYPDSQTIYEPIEPGFGAINRTLVIRINSVSRTMVITITESGIEIRWQDTYIEFGDETLTFGE